jgi:hypothetical protein
VITFINASFMPHWARLLSNYTVKSITAGFEETGNESAFLVVKAHALLLWNQACCDFKHVAVNFLTDNQVLAKTA